MFDEVRHHLDAAFSSAMRAHERAAMPGEEQSWRKS